MVHFTPQSSPWDQAEAVLQMRPHPCSAFPDPILLPSQPSPKGAPPTAVNPSGSESLPQTVHSGNLTSQSNSVVKKKKQQKTCSSRNTHLHIQNMDLEVGRDRVSACSTSHFPPHGMSRSQSQHLFSSCTPRLCKGVQMQLGSEREAVVREVFEPS